MAAGKRQQPDAGGNPSAADLGPARILANMQAAYEASVASVDNYLVVEKINISPMPSIVYYEKVLGDGSKETAASKGEAGKTAKNEGGAVTPATGGGRSYFRQVPLPELAQREARANAAAAKTADAKAGAELMANPMAFLGALAKGLDALGQGSGSGIVEEASSGLADAIRKVQSDVTGQAQEDAKDSGDDQLGLIATAFEVKALEAFDIYGKAGNSVGVRYGIYFPDRGSPEQRFQSVEPPYMLWFSYPNKYEIQEQKKKLGESNAGPVHVGRVKVVTGPVDIPAGGVQCIIFVRTRPIDFEHKGSIHTMELGEVWAADDYEGGFRNFRNPVMVRIKMTIRSLGPNGFQRIVIDRETDDYRKAGPMRVPHRTRQRMAMDGQALPEIVKSIQKISVNEGPPTQAEIAAILADAMAGPAPGASGPK